MFPILYLGGYNYTDNNGKVVFEYHVDTIPEFQKIMADKLFGVNMGVTMGLGVWPLTEFGQDKCIFKQYIFQHKAWMHKKKIRPRPKDEEYGLMISAFLSRLFGFVMVMTEYELEKLN